MYASFALIAAFAVSSVDAIVTGGADFGPSAAYAEEYQAASVAAAPNPAPPAEPSGNADIPKTVAPQRVDYSFTTEVLLGGPEVIIGEESFVIDASVATDLATAF
ncbi:MAG: hypothetical protein AB7P97_10050 [Hyphomonadaceae bacterium]